MDGTRVLESTLLRGREAEAWRVDHVFGSEEGRNVTCDEAVKASAGQK